MSLAASVRHKSQWPCAIGYIPLLNPKSVIRPKQGNYQDIIASFQIIDKVNDYCFWHSLANNAVSF